MDYQEDPFLPPFAYLVVGSFFLTGFLIVCLSQLRCLIEKNALEREMVCLAS
jgi:hypothetical protein